MKKNSSRLIAERDRSGKIVTLRCNGKSIEFQQPNLFILEPHTEYAKTEIITINQTELQGIRLSDVPMGLRIMLIDDDGEHIWPVILSWADDYYAYCLEANENYEYGGALIDAIKQRELVLKDCFFDETLFDSEREYLVAAFRIRLDDTLLISDAIRHSNLVIQELEAFSWQILGKKPPAPRKRQKPVGMFLSHSWQDKAFTRKLASGLQAHGIRVWLDEAEMLPGDSLIKKLERAIRDMDYLCVVLSPDSVESEWVQREVEIALHEEIEGKMIKVIPLLYKKCDIPPFLHNKIYADCTTETRYQKALGQISRRAQEGKIAE